MGFSGGGSNVLLPHTHDGTVAQDGGPLDFDNVTQADLTAGDVVYSDGAHLQRLAIGSPAQQIQVNAGATAPEYFTPAAGGSTVTLIATTTLGAPASNITVTGFTEPQAGNSKFFGTCDTQKANSSNELLMRINGITTGTYSSTNFYNLSGTTSSSFSSGNSKLQIVPNNYGSNSSTWFEIICNQVTDELQYKIISTTESDSIWQTGTNSTAAQTALTEIDIYFGNGAGSLAAGSVLSVYKVSNT